MRFSSPILATGLLLMTAVPGQASRLHHGPTAGRHKVKAASVSRPRAMDDERATEIQNALVKAGYLQSASGHWDATSEAAMEKLQADNGWQTKLVPDSRALIKLGLGPNAEASAAPMPVPGAAVDTERMAEEEAGK
jgi:hypothetical protein